MNTADIRNKFFDFFKEKNHSIIPSAPIVPEHDANVLFTTAGMHPLVPYLLGEQHHAGKRLANSQKCVRTTDIEEVGDATHHTFFEMLGNWSLGDYFKESSIPWSFEFLTDPKWLGIDPHKLYVTVYEGDDQVPKDTESIKIWQETFAKVGIDAKEGGRILALGRDDNWWEQGGVETGPAGPDTEIYYYLGNKEEPTFDVDDAEFVEIWNNVFMSYQRQVDGSYIELKQKNVDTGMGLERMAATIQGVDNTYDTDLLKELKDTIAEYAKSHHHDTFVATHPDTQLRALRIITDHTRAVTFMASAGLVPSNVERGYVMRRLARRAIREGLVIGITSDLLVTIAPKVVELYSDPYVELAEHRQTIIEVLGREEQIFRQTLARGLKEMEKLVGEERRLDGATAFKLYDTYGFPYELSLEEATRLGLSISGDLEAEFKRLMAEQKERSRTAGAGQFKGGLADHSETATRYHTATHLMYRALRNVLGDHVVQRGSNITNERLRFDFSHHAKMTPEEIKAVEDMVNEAIAKDYPVTWEEMKTADAFEVGALGAFGDKYGDSVKVYTVGDKAGDWYSKEICGGPHVEHTGEIGTFKIKKEESSSAGVRRIKAVIE